MKRIFILLVPLFLAAGPVLAQISPNALGIRLEGGDGLGPEISYQRALGDNNRIEVNLGFRGSRHLDVIQLTGLYEWVWNISGGLNWYAGVGGAIGVVDFDDNHPVFHDPDFDDDNSVYLTVDGIVGIEYSFADMGVPILVGLDLNPDIEIINKYYNDDFLSVALSVRFQF